jgi:hypothetical protein
MTATVRDVIKALQKFPMDTPVFTYNECDECDGVIEVVELYTPTQKDRQKYENSLKEQDSWWAGYIYPPHGCKGDSVVSDYWREKGLRPVVYLREAGWAERNDERKEDVICLTADM